MFEPREPVQKEILGAGTEIKRLNLKERGRIDILSSEGNCEIASPHSNHVPILEQSALYRNIASKAQGG